MRKPGTALAVLAAFGTVLSTTPAMAQHHHGPDRHAQHERHDRHARHEWQRRHERHERREARREHRRHWRYYGGRYGYEGYRGHWRRGERFPYYRDRRYAIYNYRTYDLPPPRAGYRYYRDRNGDIVMASIASGIIGLIIGSAIADGR